MGNFSQGDLHTLATRVRRWCSEAWQATAATDVLSKLDGQMLQEIAHDCGISADQLKMLAKAGPHAADEMASLMSELHIDPAEVQRLHPAHYRDMQINCSLCESKDRCRQDLATHTLARDYARYCSNTHHFAVLKPSHEA